MPDIEECDNPLGTERQVAAGLASLGRTYNASSCVIVGQGISARHDILLPPVKETAENVYTGKKKVVVKELGIVRYTVYNGELL